MISDLTHYAILCAHQHSAGYFAERSLEDSCSRASAIEDIMNGTVAHVLKVFAFNPIEHTCDDVTGDIAVEIANLLDPHEEFPEWLLDFIETHASIENTHGLKRADPTFTAI